MFYISLTVLKFQGPSRSETILMLRIVFIKSVGFKSRHLCETHVQLLNIIDDFAKGL